MSVGHFRSNDALIVCTSPKSYGVSILIRYADYTLESRLSTVRLVKNPILCMEYSAWNNTSTIMPIVIRGWGAAATDTD